MKDSPEMAGWKFPEDIRGWFGRAEPVIRSRELCFAR